MGFWDGTGMLYYMQTIGTLLQTDNHTNTPSLNFYRPDAIPDAQPAVSKAGSTVMTQYYWITQHRPIAMTSVKLYSAE